MENSNKLWRLIAEIKSLKRTIAAVLLAWCVERTIRKEQLDEWKTKVYYKYKTIESIASLLALHGGGGAAAAATQHRPSILQLRVFKTVLRKTTSTLSKSGPYVCLRFHHTFTHKKSRSKAHVVYLACQVVSWLVWRTCEIEFFSVGHHLPPPLIHFSLGGSRHHLLQFKRALPVIVVEWIHSNPGENPIATPQVWKYVQTQGDAPDSWQQAGR